jgi:hypothetical protein
VSRDWVGRGLDVHQERVYISGLLDGLIRMIRKIDIWMEIGILDDAFFIVRNDPPVDAPNIMIEKVDFR